MLNIDKKVLIKEGITGILCGILLGFGGLIFGASIGGNVDWIPYFRGAAAGYEAGGVLGALIGISLGSLLGVWIIAMILKTKGSWKGAVLGLIAGGVLNFILYDYNMPGFFLILMVGLPTLFTIVGYHLLFQE